MRKKIELSMKTIDVLMIMSESNPGAISVMSQILEKEPVKGIYILLSLDDMNIRGSQIWIGYKDHCKENIETFIKKIDDRDSEMVTTINKYPVKNELAVTSGGSNRVSEVTGKKTDQLTDFLKMINEDM